jgi:hypothetical protein
MNQGVSCRSNNRGLARTRTCLARGADHGGVAWDVVQLVGLGGTSDGEGAQ